MVGVKYQPSRVNVKSPYTGMITKLPGAEKAAWLFSLRYRESGEREVNPFQDFAAFAKEFTAGIRKKLRKARRSAWVAAGHLAPGRVARPAVAAGNGLFVENLLDMLVAGLAAPGTPAAEAAAGDERQREETWTRNEYGCRNDPTDGTGVARGARRSRPKRRCPSMGPHSHT